MGRFKQRALALPIQASDTLCRLFNKAYDDTEIVGEAYNQPGFFTPDEAEALAQYFGLRDPEDRAAW